MSAIDPVTLCRDDRMFLLSLNHKMLSESSQIMPESLFISFYTHPCGVKFIVDFSIMNVKVMII